LLPSSGWIKPKPFWPLNHFTVPCVICTFFQVRVQVRLRTRSPVNVRDLEEVVSPTRIARQGQVVRPKLDCLEIEDGRAFRKGARARTPKRLAICACNPYLDESVSPRPPVAERPDCAPASSRETGVTQTCPINIAREISRRWEPRLSAVEIIMTPATGFAKSARDMRRSASSRRSTGAKARSLPLAVPRLR
jgi:hypothetical protein